jgi:hypothetical protein
MEAAVLSINSVALPLQQLRQRLRGALVHESKFGKTVAACTPIHIRTA